MTASEYLLPVAMRAPSPGADGMVRAAAVDPASPIDVGHDPQFVDVAMGLPRGPLSVRQRVDLRLSHPAPVAH